MDGLTGAVQERMIAESKTKSGHMMLNMNLFSIGYLAVGVYDSILYCQRSWNLSSFMGSFVDPPF